MSTIAVNPMAISTSRRATSVRARRAPAGRQPVAPVDGVGRGVRWDAPLALTTRGRRALGLVGLALIVVVVLLGGRAVADSPAEPIAVDTYTVSDGETLWAIAAAYTAPHEDVRDTVAELVELNGRASASLRAGEQILVPAS